MFRSKFSQDGRGSSGPSGEKQMDFSKSKNRKGLSLQMSCLFCKFSYKTVHRCLPKHDTMEIISQGHNVGLRSG
ncbi:hypothetical protein TNCV_4770281 [Trichonephila clavipes]|nr:hypothetical protein TNCV_4770281 [Trichonephila clavipes]